MTIGDWLDTAGRWRTLVLLVTVPAMILLVGLLLWVAIEPLMARRRRGRAPITLPEAAEAEANAAPVYHAHPGAARPHQPGSLAVSHAAAMARIYGAKIYLLHVEEGVTSQIYGPASSTAEVEAGEAVSRTHRAIAARAGCHRGNGDLALLVSAQGNRALRA